MMPTLKALKKRHVESCNNCIATTQCGDGRSKVTLPKGSALAFSCDHCSAFDPLKKHPDWIICHCSGSGINWSVLELKGNVDAKQIRAQLEVGIGTIHDSDLFRLDKPKTPEIKAITIYDGRIRSADLQLLQQPIKFRGKKYRATALRGGRSISLETCVDRPVI